MICGSPSQAFKVQSRLMERLLLLHQRASKHTQFADLRFQIAQSADDGGERMVWHNLYKHRHCMVPTFVRPVVVAAWRRPSFTEAVVSSYLWSFWSYFTRARFGASIGRLCGALLAIICTLVCLAEGSAIDRCRAEKWYLPVYWERQRLLALWSCWCKSKCYDLWDDRLSILQAHSQYKLFYFMDQTFTF